jgi:hypothetical protein
MDVKALFERLLGERVCLFYTVMDEGKGSTYTWEGKLIGVFGDLVVMENDEKDWKAYQRYVMFNLVAIQVHSVSADVNPLVEGDHGQATDSLVS